MWEYNAPQYVDFTTRLDDDRADAYFDVDHEMDLESQMICENRIIRLLEDSVLSDTMCVGEEQGSACAVPQNDTSSTPVKNKMSTSNTPHSDSILTRSRTSSVRESQGNTSVSAYEDALAELSSTKTPVLPTRSRATPLRRSARKAAQSNESISTSSEDKVPSSLYRSADKPRSREMMSREPSGPPEVRSGGNDRTAMSKQATNLPSQHHRHGQSGSEYRQAGARGNLNKSYDSVKKQCLRSRTRSLDRVNTSNVKNASAKNLRSNVKQNDAKVGRLRSQSEEREETQKLSANKSRPQMKLTIPHTPQLLKRELKFLHTMPVQSSEVQELNKIRELRRALADKRRLAEESRVKALAAPAPCMAIRSAHPLTEPEGFHFATDDRLKTHGMETRQDAGQYKEACFTSDLRHYTTVTTKPTGPTLPQPFHLTTDRKRKLSDGDMPNSKFESIAEKVIKFTSKTPERFRKRPSPAAGHTMDHSGRSADSGGRLTVPKTPNFETRRRLRPNRAVSQTEREEMELQEAKKYQFRAKPVKSEIFVNSALGIKKVIPRQCTVPEEFHMEIEERLKQRHTDEVHDKTKEFEFHARPVPKAILDGPVGVQPAKPAPLTVPQSPAFALKQMTRTVAAAAQEQEQPEIVHIKARPVPHRGIPFQAVLAHQKTEVVPFSFDERDKEMFARKEEKIKTVLEEEKKAREFKANPMRDLTPVLPRKRVQTPTKPVPFELEVDVRGAVKAEEYKKQRGEDAKKLKDLASFKAQFPNILASKPFMPAKSNRPLTEIRDVQLNTDRRAESRLEWEKWKHEKETEAVLERCAREKQRRDDEAAEVARARAAAVHKAQPVRHYCPVDVHPSSQILTMPESPKFSERLRSKTSRL